MPYKFRLHGKAGFTQVNYTYGYPQTVTLYSFGTGGQFVYSENHGGPPSGYRGRDEGGGFSNYKVTSTMEMEPEWYRAVPYKDGFVYNTQTVLLPSLDCLAFKDWYKLDPIQVPQRIMAAAPDGDSDAYLDAFGATAVSRVSPTNPTVDLAASIGELISERKFFSLPGKADNLAGEYLNYSFGISPVVSDAKSLYDASMHKEKILAQYERDSGRLIRRSYRPNAERSVHVDRKENVYPAFAGSSLSTYQVKPGTLSTTTTTVTRRWFSGAFTYYLPKEGWRRSIALKDHLYGVRPGIDTAWELIPFSWLVDYFSNIGDVVKNINSLNQDGLVIAYGYAMSETLEEKLYSWTGPVIQDGLWVKRTFTATVSGKRQQRRKANPYGFGVDFSSLTARQASILLALGLTRV